jgi:UDP-2,3-diacylglucosamine pyrophosphatase LpxH
VSRVLAVGDVHLGAHNAAEGAFEDFLDQVYADRSAVDQVVLLGDLWDLIRRDPADVRWETSGTVDRINRLASGVPVTYVLGNHDANLGPIEDALSGVRFRDYYATEVDGTSVWFTHGNEFDRFQFDRVSRALSGSGFQGDIDPTRGRKDLFVAKARDAVIGLRDSLGLAADGGGPSYPRRERRAHDHLEDIPADKLVFGHTHAPYVHHANRVANPGSWKTTAPVHNTYLDIEAGDLELFRFHEDGPNDRLA